MASGQDLPHPDEDQDKARKARQRANATEAEREAREKRTADEDTGDKGPKVTVVVSDTNGATVRRFTRPVQQGINRLAWDLHHDGVRPLPGPKPPEPDADLPPGVEVPPGEYRLSLSLAKENEQPVEQSITVTVKADPRSGISAEQRESNYHSMLALQDMQEAAVSAVERIVHTRSDLDTIDRLIAQRPDAAADDSLKSLKERSASLRTGLDALEAEFRVPPETVGEIYNEDKVINQIELATSYAGSSLDAETAAAAVYVDLARGHLEAAVADMNAFFDTEVGPFRPQVEAAGIGLLSGPAAPGN